MSKQYKLRLLWIAVKLFDKSVDKATWVETANNLAQDFEVHFVTGWRDQPHEIFIDDRLIQYFPQFGSGVIRKISRQLLMVNAAKRLITKLRPQVVVLNCNDGLRMLRSIAGSCVKYGGKPVLDIRTLPTTDNDTPEFHRFGRTLDFAANHFAGITYITEEMRQYCMKRYRLPAHRSTIWTSGVNVDIFLPSQMSLDNRPFRLIYHGGIISVNRGLDRLIQAMGIVRDLDVQLTLVSSLREPEVIAWIDRLDLQDRITLVDTIPHADVPAMIHQHHAGILPFPCYDIWNTSSPIKLFEYMACAKPVVVTDIPAHRNVLEGEPFAFFSADATAEALADSIRRAYGMCDKFPQLGEMARQKVLQKHTWDRQAEIFCDFLKEMSQ